MCFRKPGRLILPLIFVVTFLVGIVLTVGYVVIRTVPQFERSVVRAKEHELRATLAVLRGKIRQYTEEKGRPPQSLEDLAEAGCIRAVPPDPVTERKDWTPVLGMAPGSTTGASGVIDVRSSSADISSEGTPYNTW